MTFPAAMLVLAVAVALAAQTDSGEAFHAQAVTHTATIRLAGPIEKVFPLFGPVKEKQWAPGWAPQIVYPTGEEVAEGMVFTTDEHQGKTFWIITNYDPAQHRIAYANVTPGYIVNRIQIVCRAAGRDQTDATVTYAHVALGEHGNNFIQRMDDDAYAAKMKHWTEAINYSLAHGKPMPLPPSHH